MNSLYYLEDEPWRVFIEDGAEDSGPRDRILKKGSRQRKLVASGRFICRVRVFEGRNHE